MVLTDRQAACELASAGWPATLIPTMVAIGHKESGLNTDAVNADPSVADAPPTGWLQVRAFPDRTARWNLRDPLQNAQAGYSVYQSQGLGAWSTWPAAQSALPGVQASLAGWTPAQCTGSVGSAAQGDPTGLAGATRTVGLQFLAGGQVLAGLIAIVVAGLLILQATTGAGGAAVRGVARKNPILRALV